MPRDTLKIVSMNLTKAGRKHESYLRQLLDIEQPDLCLLPGDNQSLKTSVVLGYEQLSSQGQQDTVLLYKAEKIKLNWSPVWANGLLQLPGINADYLVCPEAVIEQGQGKGPRTISILTWHYSLTRWEGVDRSMQAMNIVRMSQDIALSRKTPILIGGDFNLDVNTIQNIAKHANTEGTQSFLKGAANSGLFPSDVWLPSMIKGTLTPQRHLIAMNVYSCKQNTSVVAQYGVHQNADYFIASKSIRLEETSLVDFGCATGKTTHVQQREVEQPKPTQNGTSSYTPTKATMYTEPRPPKHYGG